MCIDDETEPGEVSWFQGCVAIFGLLIVVVAIIVPLVLLGRS